jgi:pimeloyl-ACP methyl ester carboxylesterase
MAVFHAWQFTHFYPDAERVDLKSLGIAGKANVLFFGYKFPKSVVRTSPSLPFETISLLTKDNLKISGWLVKNDSSDNAVVLLHGHAGTKGTLVEQATYFYKLGYSTLSIDFRAHGDSDGNTCTVGYDEAEEVKLAFDYMVNAGYENIVLFGSSMGAAAIIKAIHDYDLNAERLILEMPFGSLPDAVKGRMRIIGLPTVPFSQLLTFWGGVEQGYWAFNFSPCDYASSIKCPVLLQWGDQDIRVQRYETDCIFGNIQTEKKLVIFEGAGHQTLYRYDATKWEYEVTDFLVSKP